jgi:hypothetical protein
MNRSPFLATYQASQSLGSYISRGSSCDGSQRMYVLYSLIDFVLVSRNRQLALQL